MKPTAPRGGWSRQPSRDWSALSLALASLILAAGAVCLLVAAHTYR